jgi:amino acid adenylation domain-containing protein
MTQDNSRSSRYPTLLHLLSERASEAPDFRLYTFLEDREGDERSITQAALDAKARRIATALQAVAAPGERVILLYPPGLEYISAFLGCLYGAMAAVPAYPPDPTRLERTLPRLRAIVKDARATVVLTIASIAAMKDFLFAQAPDLGELRWIATDVIPEGSERAWQRPDIGTGTLAFLQYTSGSTGTPKGVMLSHGNLLHNLGLSAHAFRLRRESIGVFWLPPYHDMGLIGGILGPLYTGFTAALMSPLTFLRRPYRWLQAISRFRATVSGGPNFAYDLCVRRIGPEEASTLDLSSWTLAFSGAEPIRPETLDRFVETFGPRGFRRERFYPCYGLAEGTLIVSGGEPSEPPILQVVDARALERHRVEPVPPEQPEARAVVSCGRSLLDQRLVIAHPETLARCPQGTVGEVWVKGPSVALGYWQQPEETARVFEARLSDTGEGPFLRTGDLGFLLGEELFVTGRLKDLVIIRGRNCYPQDIEQTVERCHPALRAGNVAVFSVEVASEERLVVVQEADPRKLTDLDEVVAAVRRVVAETHELPLYALVLIEPGSIFKTSSGKIQRRACRAAYLAGELPVLAAWTDGAATERVEPIEAAPAADLSTVEAVERWLVERLSARLQLRAEDVDVSAAITRYGIDSLASVELAHDMERTLGVVMSMESLLAGPSIAELAQRLFAQREAGRAGTISRAPVGAELPLALAQQRLWFLDQLQPGNPFYNIPVAIRLEGHLNAEAMERSLAEIVRRHGSLRTVFSTVDGKPVPRVLAARPLELRVSDLSDQLSGRPEQTRWAEAVQVSGELARQPFDLEHGPLFRAHLVRLGPKEHVLVMVVHHIAADAWSMGVLGRELEACYRAFSAGRPAPLPELPIQYADFARWQREWLTGRMLDEQIGYWRQRLAGAAALALPTDHPRPPVQTYRGATHTVVLPAALVRKLRALARAEDSTLFMVLMAAFHALLHRYSGQEDISVGTAVAGRDRAELDGLIGFFVNTLVLRVDLSGQPTFRELVGRVREATLGAFAHQDVPFERLVEALQPARDLSRSPLIQAMLVLRNAQALPRLEGLAVSEVPVHTGAVAFDLQLGMTEEERGLVGVFEYSTSLFEPATIARMGEHLQVLLESAVADPERRLGALEVSSAAERELLLVTWNATEAPFAYDRTIVDLFEARVAQQPSATAVVFERRELSYGELNARANRVARRLRELGVGPESLVGLYVDRSFAMVIGALGISKSGAAYVPLDPDYPAQRLTYILEDARPRVVLTVEALLGTLPRTDAQVWCLDRDWSEIERYGAEDLVGPRYPESLAYLIYTSGSTGRPKAVAIEHRSTAAFVAWAREVFDDDELSGVLGSTSLCFDLSVFELFVPLCWGGTVILAQNALALPGLADAARVRLVNTVPSAMGELVRLRALPAGVRTVNLAGEALPGKLVDSLYELGVSRVLNLYGPSEDTTYSTFTVVPRGSDRAPAIGRPVGNTQVYLLDPALQPVPLGTVGEVYLGGMGLARGYLHRPDLTAERFIPDPFGKKPGGRLYRTGDLARYRADGNLEFLGRIDHQVKIRGFRIELGEIEAALLEHEAVEEVVVVAREDRPGDQRLVAYFTQKDERPLAGELRSWLRRRLPAYMVPSAFVRMDALPLTPNRKVDRKALPAPEAGWAATEREWAAPATATEELLAQVWSQLLGVQQVGRGDNFFELGGHSLLGMQVVSRMRGVFGVELPIRALFDAPTLADLAARVDAALAAQKGKRAPALRRVERTGKEPLAFAQQQIWLLDRLEPDSPLYNLPAALRLEGALDQGALERSLGEVVRRHEALRTVFLEEGGERAQVVLPASELRVDRVDLRGVPAARRAEEVTRAAEAEARRPFDLEKGPLLRATLLELGDTEHVLVVVMHHIASDGWSIGVLARELSALYEAFRQGRGSPLPELSIQYLDFAVWQRELLAGGALDEQLAYWRKQLEGAPRVLELPTDRPRPAVQGHRGSRVPVAIPQQVTAALKTVAHEQGATLFMALLAGFQALLYRYSGEQDLCVGSPIAGRNQAEVEGLIGVFVNTLVLRTRLDGDVTLRQLLGRVREVTLGAYANQDVPFERLVEELRPERSMSHTPLFQVMMVLQQNAAPHLRLPGLTVAMEELDSGASKFDLTLSMAETEAGLAGWLEYDADLFDAETVARMAQHLRMLLEGAVASPDTPVARLPLLTEAERRQVLVAWNQTAVDYPRDATIPELFAQQAARSPAAVALESGEERVTYQELDARANRLANYLVRRGVKPGTRVGLSLPRSVDMVVGILGILKAGAAYVPLDASYPPERLAFMREDAGLAVIVTNAQMQQALPGGAESVCVDTVHDAIARESAQAPPVAAGAESLAYVMYTSGSTGRPKGVCVPHRAVVRLVRGSRFIHMGPDEVFALLAPISFDASTLELWGALLNGGRLAVFPDGVLSLEEIAKLLDTHHVSTLWLTAGLFEQMANHQADALGRVRQLLAGGDVLPPRQVRERLSRGAMMVNGYGPTENTTFTCCQVLTSPAEVQGTVPIGKPIENTQVYVLDEWLQPVPVGVPGELYTGGDGLAWGYLGRPELTAERFIPDPFAGEAGARLYRTGDRVRWLPNGTIEFLGRLDGQVKIRGFRIEPGEVEAALAAHEAVQEAVVIAREDRPGDKRLVAYFVQQDERLAVSELRAWLRRQLPEYMVPSAFVPMEALPLTPNGKVDRKALPVPDDHLSSERDYQPPSTADEQELAALWSEVLRVERLGVHDDFFELGGHSMRALELLKRINRTFAVDLSYKDVYTHPTVAAVAVLIESRRQRARGSIAVERSRLTTLPLTRAQRRIWDSFIHVPESTASNMAVTVTFDEAVDIQALNACFEILADRHDGLRTRFDDSSGTVLQVVEPSADMRVQEIDLTHLSPERQAEEQARVTSAERVRPFDLRRLPLFRAFLFKRGAGRTDLLFIVNHIVSDGWSLSVLNRELRMLYDSKRRGQEVALPPAPHRFADYVLWQAAYTADPENVARAERYFERALGGTELVCARVPYDFPDRYDPHDTKTSAFRTVIPEDVADRLRAIARERSASLFLVLFSGLNLLMSELLQRRDVILGIPSANRHLNEFLNVFGYFVDPVIVRTRVESGEPFGALLSRVRENVFSALEHSVFPIEFPCALKGVPCPGIDMFHVWFNMTTFDDMAQRRLADVATRHTPMGPDSKFDFSFYPLEYANGIEINTFYKRRLYEPATIEAVVRRYVALLSEVE